MTKPITVAILDDHQAIIDGYLYRLQNARLQTVRSTGGADIQVVAALHYGEELEPALARQPVDVLILDVEVPTSPANPNPYPLLYLLPRLLETYPEMSILIISMHNQRTLVRAVAESGASGYILKDDRAANLELPTILRLVHEGGIYYSPQAAKWLKARPDDGDALLTPRQVEVLSYCAAYPEVSTAELARRLSVAPSTVRNLLSSAYLRLEAPNRVAAIAKARQMGLLAERQDPGQ